MVWSMAFMAEGDYSIGANALDQDGKVIHSRECFNLEYIDSTSDWPGVGGGFKIGDPNLGRAIKPEGVHPQLVWRGRKGKIGDAISAFVRFFVNDRFRELIERFEGDRHQFIPIEVLYKDRSHAQDMYLMNICARLQTLDLEATTAEISRSGILMPETGDVVVFSNIKPGDHHIWHDRNVRWPHGALISDALHDAIVEEGIRGLYMIHQNSTGDAP